MTTSPAIEAMPHKEVVQSCMFEGPEKLLEIWFTPAADMLPKTASPRGLRAVPVETWKHMLTYANCMVLSIISSGNVDAYLLSESSMFIFPHKLVLKTCGTTTILLALQHMLEIAATQAGFVTASGSAAMPHRIFYSRKNYLYPDQQKGPHRSWRDEIQYLDKIFSRGSAYLIGKMNGEHWHLYVNAPSEQSRLEQLVCAERTPQSNDQTLEILMTDLDREAAARFYVNGLADSSADENKKGHNLGKQVTLSSGIAGIYPADETSIDAFMFEPCGYSANGIVQCRNKQDLSHYFTIHVTPEPDCSYASFETNVPARCIGLSNNSVLANVVDVFRPGRFSVTLFEAQGDANQSHSSGGELDAVHGYRRVDRVVHELDGYDLVFRHFERLDWQGGAPRLGESVY